MTAMSHPVPDRGIIPQTVTGPLGMCALCLRQLFLDVEAERPIGQRWNTPTPAVTTYKGTATCYMHLEDLYAQTSITHNRNPSRKLRVNPEPLAPGQLGPFAIGNLIHWLTMARNRWGGGINEYEEMYEVTYRLDGDHLLIFQNGRYRAAIPLVEMATLTDWADDNA